MRHCFGWDIEQETAVKSGVAMMQIATYMAGCLHCYPAVKVAVNVVLSGYKTAPNEAISICKIFDSEKSEKGFI